MKVALFVLFLTACGSREVVTDKPLSIEYWEGPPCRIQVMIEGEPEPAAIVRNPKGSSLKCAVRSGDPQ